MLYSLRHYFTDLWKKRGISTNDRKFAQSKNKTTAQYGGFFYTKRGV